MPFTIDDVAKHTQAATTDTLKRQWVEVANSVLQRCADDGGDAETCDAQAITQANGVISKAVEEVFMGDALKEQRVTKKMGDTTHVAGDFLVVEDPEKPSTWHLPVKVNGKPDHRLMGAAWAALHGGYRGQPYTGPNKTEAIRKLTALYKSEDMDTPAEAAEMDYAGLVQHLNTAREHLTILADALMAMGDGGDEPMPDEEPEQDEPMEPDDEPMPAESSELAELGIPVVQLVEQETPANRRDPLELDVGIIKVGPGNERDNHYYTRELLERDGAAFAGLTMHVVDHREEQRSEQTDVSTVKEILGVRDLKDGAYLVARVSAYDPDFCEKTRNRAQAGELDKLQCSILAKGEAKPGEIDGKEYNVVQSITEGRFVDWVTRAGAGGKALALAENEPEEPPKETEAREVDLEEQAPRVTVADWLTVLSGYNLPGASIAKLREGEYSDVTALQEAVASEVSRLKAAGSGQPIGGDPVRQAATPQLSAAQIREAQDNVNTKYLGTRR